MRGEKETKESRTRGSSHGSPPGDVGAAAPLLLSSYAFFLLLMMFYLWTVWRRVGKVEKDMHDLERRQATAKR